MSNEESISPNPMIVRRRAIGLALLPVLEGFFDRFSDLQQLGWHSFKPFWDFKLDAAGQGDSALERQIEIERRKEYLGFGAYRSELIASLQEERGSGAPLSEADRKWSEANRHGQAFKDAYRPFRQHELQLRRAEIEQHATWISRDTPDGVERMRRLRVVGETLGPLAADIGFDRKPKSTWRSPPTLRIKLSERWCLKLQVDGPALGQETVDTIARSIIKEGPAPIGELALLLALSPFKQKAADLVVEDISVPASILLPFDQAYRHFWTTEGLPGLEINVRGRMAGISIIWTRLLDALVKAAHNLDEL